MVVLLSQVQLAQKTTLLSEARLKEQGFVERVSFHRLHREQTNYLVHAASLPRCEELLLSCRSLLITRHICLRSPPPRKHGHRCLPRFFSHTSPASPRDGQLFAAPVFRATIKLMHRINPTGVKKLLFIGHLCVPVCFSPLDSLAGGQD